MMTFSLAFPMLLGATAMAVNSAAVYDQQSRMQSAADASALAVAKELHVYRKNISELEAVGEAGVEIMLAEVGIAARPHTTDVGVEGPTNVVTVKITMVAETLLPVDVWGDNLIVVTSQAHALGAEPVVRAPSARHQKRHLPVPDGVGPNSHWWRRSAKRPITRSGFESRTAL